jgi:hypothetical protein
MDGPREASPRSQGEVDSTLSRAETTQNTLLTPSLLTYPVQTSVYTARKIICNKVTQQSVSSIQFIMALNSTDLEVTRSTIAEQVVIFSLC